MSKRLFAAALVVAGVFAGAGCSSVADGVASPPGDDGGDGAAMDTQSSEAAPVGDAGVDAPPAEVGADVTPQADTNLPPVIACASCTASQQCCSLVETPAGGGYACKDACDASARERPIECKTSAECFAKYGAVHPDCVAAVSGIAGTNDHGEPVCEMRVVTSGCTDPGHPLQPPTTCTPYDLSTSSGGGVVVLCGSDAECAAAGSGHCCPTSSGFNWGYCGTTCPMY